MITSNRRFRDDEFLIGRQWTKGKERILLKFEYVPVDRPLFPGHRLAEGGWTELLYSVYCFLPPRLPDDVVRP